jgi:hypothetical protein
MAFETVRFEELGVHKSLRERERVERGEMRRREVRIEREEGNSD